MLDKSAKLRCTKTELAERQAAMKALTEDKIDELQRAIRVSDVRVQKLQKEYDAYVTGLTAQ